MEKKFVCNICGNSDSKYIGIKNGNKYCRKCITFKSKEVEYLPRCKGSVNYELNFSLSEAQKKISKSLKDNYIASKNTLLHAVCGAGKTEIVYEVMAYVLSNGGKVGFAIPRRDVVIELEPRIKSTFKSMKIVSVFGGHTQKLDGDIIILTTHQLYRYHNFFDLLIIDEIDAFPFQNNDVLKAFFKKSIRTNYILMSATPSKEVIEEFSNSSSRVEHLFNRFHGFEIPCPVIIKKSFIGQISFILKKINQYIVENKSLLIFVPTINIGNQLFKILRPFVKSISYVNSKIDNKDKITLNFKKKKIKCLISTSILERGITIENLQVIVFESNHKIFNRQNLIQMAGRVGRKTKFPEGDVYFLAKDITSEMQKAIEEIEYANKHM